MKKRPYVLLTVRISDMEDIVSSYMKDGYTPMGGVSVHVENDGRGGENVYASQAMILNEAHRG